MCFYFLLPLLFLQRGQANMNWIFGVVKGIVYFMLFSSVLEQLVWDTKMEKYIRFFTGLLLCMVLVNTVSKGMDIDTWDENIQNWYQDKDNLEEEFQQQEEKVQDKIESYQQENNLQEETKEEKENFVQIEPVESIDAVEEIP